MMRASSNSRKHSAWRSRLGGMTAGLYCLCAFAVSEGLAVAFDDTLDMETVEFAEHGSAGLPQFDPSSYPSQIFWLFIIFAIMYLFFSKKTLPEISAVLENRRNHIQGDLETAEKLKIEAENAHQAYEDSLNDARAAARSAVVAAHEQIEALQVGQSKAFTDKSEQDIQALEKRLQKAKIDAMEEMGSIAAEVARDAAEKIVGISTDLKQAKTVVKSLQGKEAA